MKITLKNTDGTSIEYEVPAEDLEAVVTASVLQLAGKHYVFTSSSGKFRMKPVFEQCQSPVSLDRPERPTYQVHQSAPGDLSNVWRDVSMDEYNRAPAYGRRIVRIVG